MESNYITGVVYCVVDIICAVILFYCTYSVHKVTDRSSITKYVFLTYLFAAMGAVADISYGIREYHIYYVSQASAYFWTIACVICPMLSGLTWVFYSQKKQDGCLVKSHNCLVFVTIIYAIMIALILTTNYTHLYFYFDGHHYCRGPIFIPVSILSYLFCLISGIRAFIKSFEKGHYTDRMELRRLFGYSVSIVLVQTLQLVTPHFLPVRTIGTMLILLFWMVQNLKEMIGVDGLTHIKNRFAAEHKLEKNIRNGEPFGAALIDIDRFKMINDTYGHLEGDKAIKNVATVIKDTLGKDFSVSRLGGDEFAAIGGKTVEELQEIEERINANIESILEHEKREYRITVSAGYILWDGTIDNVPDLLAAIDTKLYERKAVKKCSDLKEP